MMTIIRSPDYSDLISEANRRFESCNSAEGFCTGIQEAERMLCDLDSFSHHFVLACLMDRQIRAEKAWAVPYAIGNYVGGFDFPSYEEISLKKLQKIFEHKRLHRFHSKMAGIFFNGIQRIRGTYDGDAKQIWVGNPPCARVVRKFLEFEGSGPKIATMATNILLRQFKIPMTHYSSIDISADRQVMKYFQNKGLLRAEAKKEELIYFAREANPDYPGLLDLLAWEGGRELRFKASKAKI
jgi:hypothetical protein